MDASSHALLQVSDLRIEFDSDRGPVPAVRGVDFQIAEGETAALVGESGCGKSVTALSILRILGATGRVAGGSIRFDGVDLATLNEAQMREIRGQRIGMVFQEPMTSLNPVISVGEQIAEVIVLHRALSPSAAWSEAVSLLDRVGIPAAERRAKQYPHELSGGMKQRAMIAMALACRPRLLLADEPTTALDVTIQAQILALLKSLQAEFKMAILLITHDLGVVAHFAENVHVMYAGKIVERAKTADLFRSPLHPYTRALLGALPRPGHAGERLEAIPGRVPVPLALPPGCAFSARCKSVLERCPRDLPELREKGAGQAVACWLHEGAAP
ncbi:MAG TPA: ABC transporter ATP-binding protein [Polyangiaceae bacterium]|nr:ABC transporter ATP-binding protein [Polyangiaceae bacterium]